MYLFYSFTKISALNLDECKLRSITETCICMLVYVYQNESLIKIILGCKALAKTMGLLVQNSYYRDMTA